MEKPLTLEHAETRTSGLPFRISHARPRLWRTERRWTRLADTAILILGAARSGTTWLAKIFDSHPDVLYRHEPDEASPADPALDPRAQMAAWIAQRSLRAACKRPQFPKRWRPPAAEGARSAVAALLAGAQRLLRTNHASAILTLPDLVPGSRWSSVRAAVKLVNWDGSTVAQALPGTRSVFILRHPCGQVASVMAGRAARHFPQMGHADTGTGMAMAEARAVRAGISPAAFAALPEAGQLAWAWVAFNEPALHGLNDRANAQVVRYEDLCREPERSAQSLFAFAGLSWHPQTAAFLAHSTHEDRGAGYFDVFRSGAGVAERWRQTMRPEDQDAVRSVVGSTELARWWPDLTA